MDLFVNANSQHTPAKDYVNAHFGTDRAEHDLVTGLINNIDKLLESIHLSAPKHPNLKELELGCTVEENPVRLFAAADATLQDGRDDVQQERLKEIQRLAMLVEGFVQKAAARQPQAPPKLANLPAPPAGPAIPDQTVTDSFALTYDAPATAAPGRLRVCSASVTGPVDPSGTQGSIPITGFTVNGNPVDLSKSATPLQALQAYLDANNNGVVSGGAPTVVGVQYVVPKNVPHGAPIVDELAATLTVGDAIAENSATAISFTFVKPPISVAAANGVAVPGKPNTDLFTFTNLSAAQGFFQLTGPATILEPMPGLAPTGYTLTPPGGVQSGPMDFKTLNNTLSTTAVAPNASVTIGVTYIGPDANAGQVVVTQLSAVFSALERLSDPATATALDPVKPAPQLQITPSLPQNVISGMTSTDTFTLTNNSGQPATIVLDGIDLTYTDAAGKPKDYHSDPFTAFTVNGADVVLGASATLAQALADAIAGVAPTPDNGTITIVATYTVPIGKPGDQIAVSLTAHANAGSISGPSTTGTVNNTFGAFTDVLKNLATMLYAELKNQRTLPQGEEIDTVLAGVLEQAETQVAAFVNFSARLDVDSGDLAHAVAIHNLVDDLYGRLLAQAQPAVVADTVPNVR